MTESGKRCTGCAPSTWGWLRALGAVDCPTPGGEGVSPADIEWIPLLETPQALGGASRILEDYVRLCRQSSLRFPPNTCGLSLRVRPRPQLRPGPGGPVRQAVLQRVPPASARTSGIPTFSPIIGVGLPTVSRRADAGAGVDRRLSAGSIPAYAPPQSSPPSVTITRSGR